MSNQKEIKNQFEDKVVSIKIKDIQQLKIILATWYSYLLVKNKENKNINFQEAIKTPIIYNIEKDELELLLSGTEEILKELNLYIQNLNQELKSRT